MLNARVQIIHSHLATAPEHLETKQDFKQIPNWNSANLLFSKPFSRQRPEVIGSKKRQRFFLTCSTAVIRPGPSASLTANVTVSSDTRVTPSFIDNPAHLRESDKGQEVDTWRSSRFPLAAQPDSLNGVWGSNSDSAVENQRSLRGAYGPPSLIVFSGGTAFNGLVEELKALTSRVAHVLPVSDDGGSTSEIVRVLGGPAIGDIRSRCLRLSDASSGEALAVKELLGHRLSMNQTEAKAEWLSIVEGDAMVWDGISEPYKDTIRAFLVHFQHQILRHSAEKFSFQNGSIGNFFFTGARTFFQSLDAAIFLFSRVARIHTDSLVLPSICTNDRISLGAELEDGTVIRGQNQISHPTVLETSRNLPKVVDKVYSPPLPSPIKRLFYISTEGTSYCHEVYPLVNPRVVESVRSVDVVIFGVGSLYTSICPSLILLLNGVYDRETYGMTAADFTMAICNALNRKFGEDGRPLQHAPSAYVTAVLAPAGGDIPIDEERLKAMGITNIVEVDSTPAEGGGAYFEGFSLTCTLSNIVRASRGVYAHWPYEAYHAEGI